MHRTRSISKARTETTPRTWHRFFAPIAAAINMLSFLTAPSR